jgi:hypothetical protein
MPPPFKQIAGALLSVFLIAASMARAKHRIDLSVLDANGNSAGLTEPE